ncbi:hypothetical protein Tco_0075313, partial [Tanacetum coccineum]
MTRPTRQPDPITPLVAVEGSAHQNAEPTSDPVVVKGYGNHHASTSGKSVQDTNVLSNNKNRNILGNIIADDPESIVDEDIVTGSSRRSKLPSRLQDYELGGKVKYGLN